MRERSLNLGSRAADILLEIGNKIDDTHFWLSRPSLVLKFGVKDARRFLDQKEKRLQRQAIQRLKNRKIISINEVSNTLHIRLYKKGILEYLRLKILESEILPRGKVCMVVFDIPESEAALRRRLRELLSRSAFIPLQKSVWISNIDAAETLSKLFKMELKNQWIRVFIADKY